MPRVCVLVPFPLDESGVENRRRQQKAVKLSPDMQLDYKPVKAGPALLDSHHDYVLGIWPCSRWDWRLPRRATTRSASTR